MAAVAADPRKYAHSPVHAAVLSRDHDTLRRLVAMLPSPAPPSSVLTEAQSAAEEAKAEAISRVLDRRDVPGQETALHLAVHVADPVAADILLAAGADWKLRNAGGWDALQEAICAGETDVARVIVRRRRAFAWAAYCRRLPRVVGTMRRMRDFYMEITFHFESSVMPFVSRIAPSDTYRIWKRGADLRADMTLAGFDGLRIQRSGQTVLFLGEGSEDGKAVPGAICAISHKHKEVVNTVEASAFRINDSEVEREVRELLQGKICRPGVNVSRAVLIPQLNWRRNEKTDTVGSWKAKVYDMHNVTVSLRSRQVAGVARDDDEREPEPEPSSTLDENEDDESEDFHDILTEKEMQQLEDAADQDRPDLDFDDGGGRRLQNQQKKQGPNGRGNAKRRKPSATNQHERASSKDAFLGDEAGKDNGNMKAPVSGSHKGPSRTNTNHQSEYKKSLRPTLWLSPDFPLSIEELLPLLDILGSKVKAVQRLRDTFTTKLPPGTFPVKVAIPVIPTVRVVVTFTKFEELKQEESEFITPPSSPDRKSSKSQAPGGGSWFRWVKDSVPYNRRNYVALREPSRRSEDLRQTFAIPRGYTWLTLEQRKKRVLMRKRAALNKGKAQSNNNK